ncbi:MAG: hypothetical protein M3R35_06070 [Candidatus Eremiobacteraeota bacterium]|nr:hypothetical protein [Candidatus Eremiobacteraeota bacterium]
MPCTAYSPDLTARDRAHYLYDSIPPGLFKVENAEDRIAWRISPEPFALSAETFEKLNALGADLLAFYRALNALYNRSARGTAPAFIAEYLDQGKPEHIVRLARQNRFKQEIPGIIRPDLMLTEGGFIASELDSVPGGMGFTAAMSEAYCRLGMESVGGAAGMPRAFAQMLAASAGVEHPNVAVVVSDESGDYRPEMTWLAQAVNQTGIATAHVCRPQDIVFTEEALFVRLEEGREEKIDAIYRNFELFDLLNVPKQELMLYATRHNRVKMTPPPKAHMEEKLAFALLHNPLLAQLWQSELGKQGKDIYARLKTLLPQTWVIDPRPLPPEGVIYGLETGVGPINDWMQLVGLGKSDRDYVVKPSGYSELAWGSRGVKVANDLSKDEWTAVLEESLRDYAKTPRILQRFHKGKRVRQSYFDRRKDEIQTFDGRVRLCPYYFVIGDTAQLGGVLATVAPADKRLIHGMSDAVMAPCIVTENGN